MIFRMSLIVMSPRRLFSWSTTSSFSIRFLWRISFACSSVVPTGTVTSRSLVITFSIGCSKLVSNLKSRLVRIPTSFPSVVIGSPEIRYLSISSRASATFCEGPTVMGSEIIPLSDFLTLSTSCACSAAVLLRWITPRPPSRAIAIAVSASVTVSIAALSSGMFSRTFGVRDTDTSTSLGRIFDSAGSRSTSSNVNPSSIPFPFIPSLPFRSRSPAESPRGDPNRLCPGR